MLKKGIKVLDSRVLILGITFKENCPDVRNTKVVDIYNSLGEYSIHRDVYDPWADPKRAEKEYGIKIFNLQSQLFNHQYDAVILAVAHNQFKDMDIRSLVREGGVVYDVKGILDRKIIDGRL